MKFYIAKLSHTHYNVLCRLRFEAQQDAEIAQLVEHFTRNEGVVGSSPIFSFIVYVLFPRTCTSAGICIIRMPREAGNPLYIIVAFFS